jgi:hypothetical protein
MCQNTSTIFSQDQILVLMSPTPSKKIKKQMVAEAGFSSRLAVVIHRLATSKQQQQ